MGNHRITAALLCGLLLVGLGIGEAAAAEKTPVSEWAGESLNLTLGGDIRIREIYFDEIPIKADPPGITRNGDNHFFRFRTRLYGQCDPSETFALRVRLVNEFRAYDKPDNSSMDFPDEAVVDTLYFDWREAMGMPLSLRVGRQDLIYGTGKLILDGTPKDGSRTIYFDAVKGTWTGIENTTVDILGIYNQTESELAINSQDRDLTGYDPAYNDMDEYGGGVYVKHSGVEDVPLEAYYLHKHETDWTDKAGERQPSRYVNTVGFRGVPKLSDMWEGNLEAAYQMGETGDADQDGFMIDAEANYHIPAMEEYKPCLGLGWYYLSGDDPNSADDEGWNPLWARWPQYSELYVYAFDADGAGRWSNVNMPHLDFTFVPTEGLKTDAMLGYMLAPEEDGPGTGDERGILGVLWNRFTLGEKLLSERDKLTGHLLLEVLDPGDYYNVSDLAYFARWEISYAF
jgi:hypothetical protein